MLHYPATYPPSILTRLPVINPGLSLSIKTTVSATSSAVPNLWIGCAFSRNATPAAKSPPKFFSANPCIAPRASGVSMVPGQMQLTRMLSAA